MTAPHDPYRHPGDDPYRSGNVHGTPQPGPPQSYGYPTGNVYGSPTSGGGYQQPQQPGWAPQQPYGQQPAYGHPPQPYQQPAYGAGVGPGGYGAPPPKKKTSAGKVIGIVAAVVIGLCVFGSVLNALGGGTDTTDTADVSSSAAQQPAAGADPTKATEPKKPEKKVAGLDTAVRDGKFEFTVKSVQCGKSQVGSEYLNKQAQGQYCLVTLSIKNIGDKAQLFDSSSQKAFGAGGEEYSADGAAGIYANPNGETFLNEINPGNSVTGVVPFDIPQGKKIAKLELHDSPFSGGVEVSVS